MVDWSGTSGSDIHRGTDAADRLRGRAGDDDLAGLAGDDFLYGESGDDVLRGGAGSDRLYGETFNPPDTGGGDDRLYGEGGNDFLNGGSGNDQLDGGAGNDLLNGWTGSDTLYGGTGNDVLNAGTEGVFQPTDAPSYFSNRLFGGDGNDSLLGGGGMDFLDGGAGNDILQGGQDADHLLGGAGDDVLDGGGWYGNLLEGGPGNDLYLFYSSGIDDVTNFVVELPGEGVDTIEYTGDLLGPDGADLPEVENFTVLSGSSFQANTPYAIFDGNAHDNRILMNHADHRWQVRGFEGRDILQGAAGDDLLEGGTGDDRLIGSAGADRLIGGDGLDDFQFNQPRDSSWVGGGRGLDAVEDFQTGADDLVFGGGFDADTTVSGRQKFTFIGDSANPGRAQLSYRQEGGNTLLLGNIDSDPASEFQVRILDLVKIAAGDILIF
jgi:Ca2+-binding RTX toxin-like protein